MICCENRSSARKQAGTKLSRDHALGKTARKSARRAAFVKPRGPQGCRAGRLLGTQLPRDRRDDARVGRLDLGRKRRRYVPVTPDQVLVEVPARQLERALEGRPFVERGGVAAPHLRLGGERKRGAEMLVRRPGDLVGAARLLPAEIVRRHADDQEAAVAKARPQFLQSGILRREPTARGGVDDQDRLAGVLDQADLAAVETG